MEIDSFIKTVDIYKDIAENVETRFDIWNYELGRLLLKAKDKEAIGLINKRWIRRKNHDKIVFDYQQKHIVT